MLPVLPTHFVNAVSNCELESIHLRRGRLNTIESNLNKDNVLRVPVVFADCYVSEDKTC